MIYAIRIIESKARKFYWLVALTGILERRIMLQTVIVIVSRDRDQKMDQDHG